MKKRSTTISKSSKQLQQITPTIDWEVRPGGMLVQKRIIGSDPGCGNTQIINIKVSHDSYHHHLSIPSTSTFGTFILFFYIIFSFFCLLECYKVDH